MALDESNSVQVFGAVESSLGKLGAFHEKGADTASLQVKGQDAWMTTLSVGARYMHHFAVVENAPSATLSLQAGVEASLGDTDSEVEVNLDEPAATASSRAEPSAIPSATTWVRVCMCR